MLSINCTRSQGYPLLAAGLLIPTGRKMRFCWYLQKKSRSECAYALYSGNTLPEKPKIWNPKKLLSLYFLRPFFLIVLKVFLPKVAVSRRWSPSNKIQDASQASPFTVRWGQPVNQAVQTCRSSTSHLANCTLVSELGGCRLGECHWDTWIRNWMES